MCVLNSDIGEGLCPSQTGENMENYFENRTELTANMMLELYKTKMKRANLLRIIGTVLCGISIVKGLVILMIEHALSKDKIIALVVYAVLITSVWLLPIVRAKRIAKKFGEHKAEKPREYQIHFGETIKFFGKETVELFYQQISGVTCLSEGIVLDIAKKRVLYVSNNGFTKGTFEEFKQFLREKCPHVTIPG